MKKLYKNSDLNRDFFETFYFEDKKNKLYKEIEVYKIRKDIEKLYLKLNDENGKFIKDAKININLFDHYKKNSICFALKLIDYIDDDCEERSLRLVDGDLLNL